MPQRLVKQAEHVQHPSRDASRTPSADDQVPGSGDYDAETVERIYRFVLGSGLSDSSRPLTAWSQEA